MANDYADLNIARLNERALDELLGICRGVVADGAVNQLEAKFLESWLDSHPGPANTFPTKPLYRRLKQIFADGRADAEELEELKALLAHFAGEPSSDIEREFRRQYRDAGPVRAATRIPIDNPAPEMIFQGMNFCFTGQFVFGTRKACEAAMKNRGAFCQANPTLKTDYLVIGLVGTESWIHTTHGRKIEQVVQMREEGKGRCKIVAEEHWVTFLT